MNYREKLKFFLIFVILFCGLSTKAQINFDFTDSLVNQQKQYIIRFDVGNGNIMVPIKKKFKSNYDTSKIFKREIVKLKEKIYVPLYKDTVINNRKVSKQYDFVEISNPALNGQKAGDEGVRYIVAGRYFKPRVDGFIRLVFENVPKDEDIKVSVDFLDKNLESAATFSNYLNSYANTLTSAINKDTDTAQVKKETEIQKIDSTQKAIRDTIIKRTSDTITTILQNSFSQLMTGTTEIDSLINIYNRSANNKIDFKRVKQTINNTIAKFLSNLDQYNQLNTGDSTNADIQDSIRQIFNRSINTLRDIETSIDETMAGSSLINRQLTNRVRRLSNSILSLNNEIDTIYGRQIKLLNDTVAYFKKMITDSIGGVRDSVYNKRTIHVQPIQVANTDLTVLNIEYIKGRNSVRRTIILKNKAGFKLDFSTGFIGTGLRDGNYRLFNRGDSSAIIEDNKGNFTIGFTFLAHAYFRTGARFNTTLTSGFAINGSNQTVNYLLGASLPLGMEQRFIISGGLVFGKVSRLSSGYKAIPDKDVLPISGYDDYFYKGLNNAGIPLTEKWNKSYFIGVTYNLGTLVGSSRRSIIAR